MREMKVLTRMNGFIRVEECHTGAMLYIEDRYTADIHAHVGDDGNDRAMADALMIAEALVMYFGRESENQEDDE